MKLKNTYNKFLYFINIKYDEDFINNDVSQEMCITKTKNYQFHIKSNNKCIK